MSQQRPDKKTREQLLAEIRQLKERVHKLKETPVEPCPKTEGLAEGIAAALGRLVPGLGGLIQNASKMPEFQQRLAAIDEEVKRKFKEQPLLRASAAVAGGHRQMGIPPSVRRGRAGWSASAGSAQAAGTGQGVPRGKHRAPRPPKVHISPETPAQLAVDVFDEGDKIVVLAEAPGLTAEQVTVSLEGQTLLITVESPQRRGRQSIGLPCDVAGEPETSLANGVLTIELRKVERE